MSESAEKLDQLQTRLENLARYESAFKDEIADIRRELAILKSAAPEPGPAPGASRRPVRGSEAPESEPTPQPQPSIEDIPRIASVFDSVGKPDERDESNIEKFVGTYLISIIGVMVTVIGVGIGAKYAIDNDLISPLFRIIFGYVVGLGLIGFAVHLKGKYETFSAALLSGGMAIVYFITFFAYSYYALISQTTAFALMVIFTVFTVVASITYNRQIIAHIGLVGAYAVPFLLSDDSGRADILFSYIALINIGILAVSLKKYWKYLFYTSFFFTWLIFAAWFFNDYDQNVHFSISLIALTAFFSIFYATFLAYKLIHKRALNIENVGLILQNSFAYFGFGYAVIDSSDWSEALGLFTILNAGAHFTVAAVIHQYKLGDKNAFYLTVALVLTFTAITVPVQFDGNWVTVMWMAEATFLFIIGRIKRIPVFEYLSYPLMSVASLSLVVDWYAGSLMPYRPSDEVFAYWTRNAFPVWNGYFASSLFVALGFGAICFVDRIKKYKSQVEENLSLLIGYLIPTAFLFVLYNTFRIEIGNYFDYQEVADRDFYGVPNSALSYFSVVWQINYSILFLTLLSYLNIKKIKSTVLGITSLGLSSVSVVVFLTIGLVALGGLRELYISQDQAEFYYRGVYLLLIRYISYLFVAAVAWLIYRQINETYLTEYVPARILAVLFDVGLSVTLLVILSVELITWTHIYQINESYKLGLSILWGIFSLSLIIIGITNRKKHLRLLAISILAMTVVKLFVYDIAELDTIPKTIVFVSIGFLLLIASFLYNKYTKLIFGEENLK